MTIHQLISRSISWLALASTCVFAAPAPPNIVIIFIDDMGYTDIAPFGNDVLKTPNLDTMASQGRKFTNFYASPVCSMSRASLLTGCYNVRISMPSVLQPNSTIGLNPEETNMANLLKNEGYATACIGKWHLGHLPEFMPMKQGFDVFFGIPYSNNMIKGYMKGKAPALPLYDGEEVIETEPDQTQFTKRFTERAIEFISENKNRPFFLYLPHPMIHTPLFASEDFKGKSKDGILGDAIEELDWSVGQIAKTLKDLDIEDNTLFIFTSDNGPATDRANGLRDMKGSTFEGGVRVPTIMRWPGKIAPNSVNDQITGTIDMLPTFAALVGAELDPSRPIDGSDVRPLLFEEDPSAIRDNHLYYGWGPGHLDAIRQGDWKLFLGDSLSPAPKKPGRPGKKSDQNKIALYNLNKDPAETTDLSNENPEIVERLTKLARNMDDEVRNNPRPIGQLNHNKK